jgi:hypothetical protein
VDKAVGEQAVAVENGKIETVNKAEDEVEEAVEVAAEEEVEEAVAVVPALNGEEEVRGLTLAP